MSKVRYKLRNREARKRNAEAREKRTPRQQLAHLDELGHRALKERARLQAQIDGSR